VCCSSNVWGYSVILVLIGREFNRALRTWLRKHNLERANLIIVGMGKIARDIARKVQNSPELGYHIVGVVTCVRRGRAAFLASQ